MCFTYYVYLLPINYSGTKSYVYQLTTREPIRRHPSRQRRRDRGDVCSRVILCIYLVFQVPNQWLSFFSNTELFNSHVLQVGLYNIMCRYYINSPTIFTSHVHEVGTADYIRKIYFKPFWAEDEERIDITDINKKKINNKYLPATDEKCMGNLCYNNKRAITYYKKYIKNRNVIFAYINII